MYIERRAFNDLPPDAIVITEEEALKNLQDSILEWKPWREVWALKFGTIILGGYNLVATTAVGSYFRNRVKLPRTGKIVFYSITSALSGLFTIGAQQGYVHNDILLQKECIECVYEKAVAYQLGAFYVYGVVASAFTSAYAAIMLNSYPVAGLTSWVQLKETSLLYLKFCRRIIPRFVALTCFGALGACFIVHRCYEELQNMNEKLKEKDEELRKAAAKFKRANTKSK